MKSKLAIFSFVTSIICIYFLLSLTGGAVPFGRGFSFTFIFPWLRYVFGFPFVLFGLGVFLLVPILAFIGLITAIISLVQIKKKKLEGKWFAITSLIISSIILFFSIVLIFNPPVFGM